MEISGFLINKEGQEYELSVKYVVCSPGTLIKALLVQKTCLSQKARI